MRQENRFRNGGGSRTSWREGSRRDIQEGWESQSTPDRSRRTSEWDEERYERGSGRDSSRRPEWESSEARGFGRESGRESWGSEGGGGSYGGYPSSSSRRGEYEGYQGSQEERGYGSRREFDESYGSQRDQSYPRNYWNPEPQYNREGRQAGQFGGGYGGGQFGGSGGYRGGQYGGGYSSSQYGGAQYGGSQSSGSQYGGRGSMESSREGYSQYGQESFRGGRGGMESDRWDRSGSEWSGMSQDSGRMGQRSQGGARTNRGPKNYKRSDDRIREDVCEQLSDSDLNCEEVEITVKNGEVTLTGTTESGQTRREIERMAEQVSGVKDVTNQIRIKRETSKSTENRTSEDRTLSSTTESTGSRRDTVKSN